MAKILLAGWGGSEQILHQAPHREHEYRDENQSGNKKVPELATGKIPPSVGVILHPKKGRKDAEYHREKGHLLVTILA